MEELPERYKDMSLEQKHRISRIGMSVNRRAIMMAAAATIGMKSTLDALMPEAPNRNEPAQSTEDRECNFAAAQAKRDRKASRRIAR